MNPEQPPATSTSVALPIPGEALLDALDQTVMLFSPEGQVVYCNAAAERHLHMTLAQMRERTLADWVLLREDGTPFPTHELPVARTLATGEPCREVVVTYAAPDGTVLWTLANTTPLRDPVTGQVQGVALWVMEITQIKRAEAEQTRIHRTLTASSASNKALVHARSVDSYAEAVCDIVVRLCGHKMAWVGLALDDAEQSVRPIAHAGFEEGYLETLQVTWADRERGRGPTGVAIRSGRPAICHHMLTDPAFLPWREQALERGYAASIAIPLREKGHTFGALMIYSSLPDPFVTEEIGLLEKLADDLAYGIGLLRVRFEHEQQEAALRASEERYRLLVEQMPDGLFVADGQGRYQEVNAVGAAMLGYSREEILRMGIADVIDPDEIPRIGPEVARFDGGSVVTSLWRFKRKDGSIFVGEVVGRRLPDGRLQAVLRDVTTRTQADKELREARLAAMNLAHDALKEQLAANQANFSLQLEIDRREAIMEELKQARADADAASRAKSEFLANMSHEIRTPLNAVLGLAQVGERDNAGRRSQESFNRIYRSGQLLLSLVNDILDFSKVEAGKMTLEHNAFDLGEVIDRAVDVNSARALGKGLDFQVEEAADLPCRLVGDSLRLTQVLVNLLSNAIKFTERGQVRLAAAWEGGALRLRIDDSGIGMTAAQTERLFSPFEQADGSTTRRYGGTGLGLVISKRLVELMGGTIRVESQPDAGSRFEIWLPLLVAGSEAMNISPAPSGRGEDWGEGYEKSGPHDLEGRIVLLGLREGESLRLRQALAAHGVQAVEGDSLTPLILAEQDLLVVTEERFPNRPATACRVAIVHTPGGEPTPLHHFPTGVHRIERPLRARHLLAALTQSAVMAPAPVQGPRLAGYRVLAAEDNEVNRFVLERMVLDEGARLLCVENGRLAVEQIERDGPGAWDILLMDIQMPEMDGHEAARRIREFAPDLPIVGLTAHAMSEERERCLASGMRDHLSKPIELEALIDAIRRIAGPPRPGMPAEPVPTLSPPAPPQPTEPLGEAGVIDWPKLEKRYVTRPGFVPRLAALARQSQAETPAKLRALAAAGEMDPLGELAHALKGVAGNLAADGIQEQAGQLHRLTKENSPEAAPLAEALAHQVEEMLEALAQVKG